MFEGQIMTTPSRLERISAASGPLHDFTDRYFTAVDGQQDVCDFTFGNPHEMPLPGLVDALSRWAVPHDKDWFAYKFSEPSAREVVAASLREWRNLDFEPEDIAITLGGFGALAAAIFALIEPGDEVIFSLPPWFLYEPMVLALGGEPVKVKVRASDFDLDLEAIEAAIGPRTRIVIVNTPNNPTGRVYPPETLNRLGDILSAASRRIGRTIYLLSDEPYSRLVFDGRPFHSPAAHYPETLIAYSYGKVLLAPGQRLGWLAMPPSVTDRERLRSLVRTTQITLGWHFPNALMQHAIGDLDKLSIDLDQLQHKRDLMVTALRDMGYDVHVPEGTFYLLPRSPIGDDEAFTEMLAAEKVFVLPGALCEIPGYFRISLTANQEMIERSLPRFARAIEIA
jgi:aspartate aminotransferase